MNPCVLAYLPPDLPKFNTRQFLQNLAENPTVNPLILFSETNYDVPGLMKVNDPAKRMNMAVDGKRDWDVNNYVFLNAIRIARAQGYTHALYLEADCRVSGEGWDEALFAEFFYATSAPLFGGSVVAYNVANAGPKAYDRFLRFVNQNRKVPFPVPPYGWKSAKDASGSCVYTNGAGSIFPIAAIESLFTPDELNHTFSTAKKIAPWDQEIGFRLWRTYESDVYDLLLHMRGLYSSYGDVLTTEETRRDLLTSGKVRLVHQIKSAWIPAKE